MFVVPPRDQLLSDICGAAWWPNFELVLVASPGGKILPFHTKIVTKKAEILILPIQSHHFNSITMPPCHHATMSPCHHAILSSCRLATLFSRHFFILSAFQVCVLLSSIASKKYFFLLHFLCGSVCELN